jgi:catechol 2,3-dioxygenase-like lactoylglutathione lyase family enzyme
MSDAGTRYAVYWAPPQDHPLWLAGAAWLGRDPAGVRPGAPPMFPGIAEITEEPSRYGFHATLKPPMRLHVDVSVAGLRQTLIEVAGSVPAFDLPPLAVDEYDGFLCLRETRESAPLRALADAMVAGLDHLRDPPSARELARRRGSDLSAAQEANLVRWGYPHVFGYWLFHMTLTRRLQPKESAAVRPVAEAWFADVLREPLRVTDVCLFEQTASGFPFVLIDRAKLAEPEPGLAPAAALRAMHLGHVILYVPELEAAMAFYEAAFGLTRRFVHESGYGEMDTGATSLGFAVEALARSNAGPYRASRPSEPPAAAEIAFTVPDVAAAYARALAAGAVSAKPPAQKPWGQTVAYVRDPNGFLVELCTVVEET